MIKLRLLYLKSAVVAVIAMTVVFGVKASRTPVTAPASVADLSSELRTLDAFVNDLRALDKQCATLGKKNALTRTELNPLESSADDLKRRLSETQNALREIIRKLKAANEWENLDATVLAKIGDPTTQTRLRQNSFRQQLETVAAQLSSQASEIGTPLDALRAKLQAQGFRSLARPGSSSLGWAAPATVQPVTLKIGLRCDLAYLRFGISAAFASHAGQPSTRADNGVKCYCYDNQDACSAL